MSDTWKCTFIFHREYMLFEDDETGDFYWLIFENENYSDKKFHGTVTVYESQRFETEHIARLALESETLNLTIQ